MVSLHEARALALLQYALDCGEQVIIACESEAAAVYTQLAYDGLVVCAGYVQASGVDCLCFELTDAGRSQMGRTNSEVTK